MNKTLTLAVIATLTVGSNQVYAGPTNLVVNGGFETGSFTGWVDDTGGAPPGIVVVAEGAPVPGWCCGTLTPYAGTYLAVLGANSADNTLSQTFTTTLAGQTYDLSFAFTSAADALPIGDFTVLWDGKTLMSYVSTNPVSPPVYPVWETPEFQVTGTGHDTLQFVSRQDPSWFGLDNVSLTVDPVSEPNSLALCGIGLLGFLGACYRKIR